MESIVKEEMKYRMNSDIHFFNTLWIQTISHIETKIKMEI